MSIPNPFVEGYVHLPNETQGFQTFHERKTHFEWSLAALLIGIFLFTGLILLLIFLDPAGVIDEFSTSVNEVDGTCAPGYGRSPEGSCQACPAGSAGDGESCHLCEADTYAPVSGSAACSPCPGALEGATSCEVSAPLEDTVPEPVITQPLEPINTEPVITEPTMEDPLASTLDSTGTLDTVDTVDTVPTDTVPASPEVTTNSTGGEVARAAVSHTGVYELPKIIWAYWHTVRIADRVARENIMHLRRILPEGWSFILLHNGNLNRYVPRSFSGQFSKIDRAHFSDYIRSYLLVHYGGIWLDAGILVSDFSFLEQYRNECIATRADALMYEYKKKSVGPYPYLENWFIVAPKGSRLMQDWMDEYIKAYKATFLIYKDKLLREGSNVKGIIENPGDTYLMMHAVLHYLFHQGKRYRIIVKQATESMFWLHDKNGWNTGRVIDDWLANVDKYTHLYAIKWTGGNRATLVPKIQQYREIIQRLEWRTARGRAYQG